MTLDRLIEDRVRAIVREELSRFGADVDAYSTDALPPRTSRRAFHEACRSGAVEGARRDGRKWVVDRAAWLHARASCAGAPPLRLVSQKTDADLADEMIAAAGFRATRVMR